MGAVGRVVIGYGLRALRLVERACNVPFVLVAVLDGEWYRYIELLVIHGLADVVVRKADDWALDVDNIQHVAHGGIGAVLRVYTVHAQRQHPFRFGMGLDKREDACGLEGNGQVNALLAGAERQFAVVGKGERTVWNCSVAYALP